MPDPVIPWQPIGDGLQIEVSRAVVLWNEKYGVTHSGMVSTSEDDPRGDLHIPGMPWERLNWDEYSHYCYADDPESTVDHP